MKGKVVNLFENKTDAKDKGVKYSKLFEQFIEPFSREFSDVEFQEDIFEFAMNAWNFGNMVLILPEDELDTSFEALKSKDINVDLLKRMIDYKVEKFSEYIKFIVDFEIKGSKTALVLSVTTQDTEDYLSDAIENGSGDLSDED